MSFFHCFVPRDCLKIQALTSQGSSGSHTRNAFDATDTGYRRIQAIFEGHERTQQDGEDTAPRIRGSLQGKLQILSKDSGVGI